MLILSIILYLLIGLAVEGMVLSFRGVVLKKELSKNLFNFILRMIIWPLDFGAILGTFLGYICLFIKTLIEKEEKKW